MSKQIAIIYGTFHAALIEEMLEEARGAAAEQELKVIQELSVPGSMEKPLALKRLLSRQDIDGAVVLGIIEKGETKHGLVMAQAVIPAIIQLQLELMKPVGVGILGPEIDAHQISSRVRPYAKAAVNACADLLR